MTPHVRPVRGAMRRVLTRLAARLPEMAYTPPGPTYSTSHSAHSSALGRRRYRLAGWLLLQIGQPVRAQRLLERSAPDPDPATMVLLGKALLQGGPTGLTFEPHLGVAERRVGDPAAALEVLEDVLDAHPDCPGALDGVTEALLHLGDLDRAEARASASGRRSSLLRAAARERRVRTDTALDRASATEIVTLLDEHLSSTPRDVDAWNRLLRHSLTVGDFGRAKHAASVIGSEAAALLADWAMLTYDGQHVEAHQRKLAFARDHGSAPPSRTAKIEAYVTWAQAANYCGGPERALDAVHDRAPFAASRAEKLLMAKVRADLTLLRGDPGPLRSLRRSNPTPNPRAEAAFEAALQGHSVLVVGPSPYFQPSREQLASADVVVTTRSSHVEFEPGQTSITYVTDETARSSSSELLAALERDTRHLLVLRPSILRAPIPTLMSHERVRTMQFDDSTPLLGTHFGIQRLLYDLLGADARSITITGVDFFLGDEAYKHGYRPPASEPTSAPPRLNFSHDYAYAFDYTKQLVHRRLVRAVPDVAMILRDPVDSYLTKLALQHPGPTPGSGA